MKIEQAKQILKDNGYFIENLWHINDVIDRHNCSRDIALNVLTDIMQSDYIIETINESINMYQVYPDEVQDIIDLHNDNVIEELNKIGWTAEYNINDELYNIRKL